MTETEPVWIDERDILAIHDRLLVLHGGLPGLRDAGLLRSALARPQQLAACGNATGIIDMAAAYTVGIVQNHPFIDGDKRTGFVAGVLFLELNGWHFAATEEASAKAVLALAAGSIHEAAFVAFLRENVAPNGDPG